MNKKYENRRASWIKMLLAQTNLNLSSDSILLQNFYDNAFTDGFDEGSKDGYQEAVWDMGDRE